MREIFMDNAKVLAGKYELQEQIGEGGYSIVYLAWDRHIERHVAIKMQKEQKKDNTEEILRNEMENLKALSHPMMPTVYDFFREDRWYLVMEYIEGESLHNFINREGKLSEKLACEWAGQLLSLLSYLHGHKPPMIYRDLKPENIMVCTDGRLKVVDFGTAFCARYDYDGNRLEKMAGTLGYAAPEQLIGGSLGNVADERSDIYNFGTTLYHMLTGSIPPVQMHGCLSVRKVNPALTQGIDRIVKKCTAADPSLRYQSVEEIKRDLDKIKYQYIQKKSSILRRIERKVWLTDKKAVGLFGIGILLTSIFISGFAVQVKGQEAALPVTVYNKQGQKLIIRYDSVYRVEGSLVFELEQKLFAGDDMCELSISLTNMGTGEKQERIFYLRGAEAHPASPTQK